MPSYPGRSRGGFGDEGGGFTLGPVQNLFASTAQISSYSTGNPSWLAEYDANSSFVVEVRAGGTSTFYRRIGNAWLNVTPIIRGPKGDPGSGAAIPATATIAEMEAGTETGLRSLSAALVRRAINAVVPAVFRTGNTSVIPDSKLPPHEDGDHLPTRPASSLTTYWLRADDVWAVIGWSVINGRPVNFDPDADSSTTTDGRIFSPAHLYQIRDDGIQSFARAGNNDPVPTSKLRNAADTRSLIGRATSTTDGLLRQLSGVATQYFDGSGNWSTPPSGGGGISTAQANALIAVWARAGDASAIPESKQRTPAQLRSAVGAASQTAAGIVELATDAEARAMAAGGVVVTPLNLAALRATAAPLGPVDGGALGSSNRFSDGAHQHPPDHSHSAHSTHTRYIAISADQTFVAADFTGGTSTTTDSGTLPTFTTNQYVALAIPDSEDDLTFFRNAGGINQIAAFTKQSGTITINSVAYKWWRSNRAFLPAASGRAVEFGS